MTVDQAAAALGVSKRLCYRLIADGELPCYRYGRRKIVISEAHVEECRRRHEWGAEPADAPRHNIRGGNPLVPDFEDIVAAIRLDRDRGKGRMK